MLANLRSLLGPCWVGFPLIVFANSLINHPIIAFGAQEQRAILQLIVNQVGKGEVLVLIREGNIMARVSDLDRSGLRGISGRRETIGGENYVSLSSLTPAVTFEMDEKDLTLRLTAQPILLGSTVLDLKQGRPPGIIYARDTSAFLNYAFNWLDFIRYDAFGEAGLSINGNLLFGSVSRRVDGAIVRGLTNLTLDHRQNLTRWVLGDKFASAGGLGGSLFLAGVSASKEFNLDPYFFPYPSLGLSDAIMTPSTVEIYVNGLLVRREKVLPGQFELKNLPVVNGSGITRVVIRDAFGREREVLSPYYFTSGVLARGLHEYSYNLGYRRNNVATANWDYGPISFLGRHRIGITDEVTAGLRFEWAPGLVSGGPTVTLGLPFGEMEFSAAASRDEGRKGAAVSFGYNYRGRFYSFGGSVRAMSPYYANMSVEALDDKTRLETNAFVGFQVGRRSNLFFNHRFEGSHGNGSIQRFSLSSNTRLTDRLSLSLIGRHSREIAGRINELSAGLTYLFGEHVASLSYEQSDNVGTGTIGLQKSLPVGSGFGYRFQATNTKEQYQVNSVLQYQGPYGRYEANHLRVNDFYTTNLSMAGGLIAIGGGFYPTRPVQDSFALVRLPGVAGVRIYSSNQEVGQTNSRGNLPVPNLLSYYGNILRIADEDISLDYKVDVTEKIVAPPYRGGAVVTFPVQRMQSLTGLMLLEISGKAATPAYGRLTITVADKRFESPIGKQGEFYFENVPAGRHSALLEYKQIACHFMLEVPASDLRAVKIGTLRCAAP